MCIHCAHRSAVILAALFSRDTGALADFTLPPTPPDEPNAAKEADHRRAIGIIGELMQAMSPVLDAKARQAPQSVLDGALREATVRLQGLYNGETIVDGKPVPRAAVLMHATLAAMHYAETMLFAARQIEELMRAQAREVPNEDGPRVWSQRFAAKRAEIAERCRTEVEFVLGGEENFPPDMPEQVRAVIRQMRAAGLDAKLVGVVEQRPGASPKHPIGTGPDGKPH